MSSGRIKKKNNMAKVRLTKTALKKEKESLKRYIQYLPTLQLKKQQLQKEASRIQHSLEELKEKAEQVKTEINTWVDVFAEDVGIDELMPEVEVLTETENIAGIDIPIFKGLGFKGEEYDPVSVPLWVDEGIEAVQRMLSYNYQTKILEKQLELVQEELRMTSQRVNLFEKVKIPETKENIRKIQIFLGDLQTAEVVTGKIAKEKIQKKEQAALA